MMPVHLWTVPPDLEFWAHGGRYCGELIAGDIHLISQLMTQHFLHWQLTGIAR